MKTHSCSRMTLMMFFLLLVSYGGQAFGLAAEETATEFEAWWKTANSTLSAERLNRFLLKYPDGKYVATAKTLLSLLDTID